MKRLLAIGLVLVSFVLIHRGISSEFDKDKPIRRKGIITGSNG